jgi:hypothetical protein
MTCKRCRKGFDEDALRCPHCGQPNPENSGVFQTSTVLISVDGAETVYRSVEEVPARLRSQLVKCTNGSNSATILIADRRGRQEMARTLRSLPGSAQRRLAQSILGDTEPDLSSWLTRRRKQTIVGLILLCLVTVIVAALSVR